MNYREKVELVRARLQAAARHAGIAALGAERGDLETAEVHSRKALEFLEAARSLP